LHVEVEAFGTPSNISSTNTTSCLPKVKDNLKFEINIEKIVGYIQFMQEHAFIGKFLGIWSSEKSLTWWINTTWKQKYHIDLKLEYKGLFTIICSNLEDHERIFEKKTYFFNSTGLHIKPWT
jgi:hypothetical protein